MKSRTHGQLFEFGSNGNGPSIFGSSDGGKWYAQEHFKICSYADRLWLVLFPSIGNALYLFPQPVSLVIDFPALVLSTFFVNHQGVAQVVQVDCQQWSTGSLGMRLWINSNELCLRGR